MKVYSVFDSTAAVFCDPIVAENDAIACRSFTWAINNPNIPDYVRTDSVLYCLGSFDCVTGMFTQDTPPFVVMRGASVQVRKSEDEDYEE